VINQNAVDPALVDIATTVDDLDGRDCSLRVEYSLDGGAKWHRAAISDVYSAEFGEVEIGNDSDFQLSGIETHQAG
jgi:hypothetical protein